jgi:NAD(P)-dependent dehydrogenase (short-subunit alcohol dehydrogenase family)
MPSKIVNLTSIGHRFVWSKFAIPRTGFFGVGCILPLQMLMIPFTRELANRLAETKVTVNVFHPGIIRTKLIRVLPVSWGVSVNHGASTVFNWQPTGIRWGHGKYLRIQDRQGHPRSPARRGCGILMENEPALGRLYNSKATFTLNGWLTQSDQ